MHLRPRNPLPCEVYTPLFSPPRVVFLSFKRLPIGVSLRTTSSPSITKTFPLTPTSVPNHRYESGRGATISLSYATPLFPPIRTCSYPLALSIFSQTAATRRHKASCSSLNNTATMPSHRHTSTRSGKCSPPFPLPPAWKLHFTPRTHRAPRYHGGLLELRLGV